MRAARATLAALVVAAVALTLASARSADAARLRVNTTADGVDARPGDGRCSVAGRAGVCTLRAAVMEANARASADTIQLAPGTYALRLAGRGENAARKGDLDVKGDLTIRGAGAARTTIDGRSLDRVLDVLEPAHLRLAAITIRNGRATLGDRGGGVQANRNARLTISDAVVTRNTTGRCPYETEPFCGMGGGVASFGTATLTRVTLTRNRTTSTTGGAIVNEGTLHLDRVTIDRNTGSTSAGGLMNGGNATVVDSEISRNSAALGGGIANGGLSTTGGGLSLTNTTISGNSATTGVGGALANGGRFGGGPVTMTNVTFSGNSAASAGGAFAVDVRGTMALVHVTIAGNTSPAGAVAVASAAGEVTLRASIIAGSSSINCFVLGPPLVSLGYNVSSDTTCALTGPGDRIGADPALEPLRRTPPARVSTHALPPNSIAVDIVRGGCPPPARDERGVGRPQDGNADGTAACDGGAFELAR